MKLIFSMLFLIMQPNFDTNTTMNTDENLVGEWAEARLDEETGSLTVAPPSRGGTSAILFSEKGEVSWKGPLACGFGSMKKGEWKLDDKKAFLVCYFSEEVGYMNKPGSAAVDEKKVWEIERLTESELILKAEDKTNLYFVKTK